FWFVNANNEEPVRVGLNSKNCKCTNVEVRLMTDDWKSRRATLLAGQVVATLPALAAPVGQPLPLSALGVMAADEAEPVLGQREQEAKLLPLMEKQNLKDSVLVPAQAIGYIRLHWSGEGAISTFNADLWQNQKGDFNVAKLEARVR